MRAGSEPTRGSVRAKAEISPAAQRGRYFFLSSSVPKSLSGWGTPIDWWAESSAPMLPQWLPMSVITRLYSTFVKPSPPYFAGIFIPKAPRRRRPSRTFGGYSPVRSISAGSTSSLQEVVELAVEGRELRALRARQGKGVNEVEAEAAEEELPHEAGLLPLRLARGLGDVRDCCSVTSGCLSVTMRFASSRDSTPRVFRSRPKSARVAGEKATRARRVVRSIRLARLAPVGAVPLNCRLLSGPDRPVTPHPRTRALALLLALAPVGRLGGRRHADRPHGDQRRDVSTTVRPTRRARGDRRRGGRPRGDITSDAKGGAATVPARGPRAGPAPREEPRFRRRRPEAALRARPSSTAAACSCRWTACPGC